MEKPKTKCWSTVPSQRCCSQVHAAWLRLRVAGDVMAHSVGGSQKAPVGCALCETEAVRHPRHPRVQGQADNRHLGTKERLQSSDVHVSRFHYLRGTWRSGSASFCLPGSRFERCMGCAPCSTHGLRQHAISYYRSQKGAGKSRFLQPQNHAATPLRVGAGRQGSRGSLPSLLLSPPASSVIAKNFTSQISPSSRRPSGFGLCCCISQLS